MVRPQFASHKPGPAWSLTFLAAITVSVKGDIKGINLVCDTMVCGQFALDADLTFCASRTLPVLYNVTGTSLQAGCIAVHPPLKAFNICCVLAGTAPGACASRTAPGSASRRWWLLARRSRTRR